MPNWVFNTVTIQGPKDQVDYIKDRLNSPYTRKYKDYWNSVTRDTEERDIHFSAPVFSFWNIIRPTDEIMDEYIGQAPRTNATLEDKDAFWAEVNQQRKESNDWYNWNNRNWGTKWDVAVHDEGSSDTYLQEHRSDGEDQWLVYRFDTAWAPPVEAMINLSKLVPNCVVTVEWQEEQGFGGEIEFVNGEITSDSEYDSKCLDCDEIDTMDYCEECENSICSSCNYLGEADLESAAKCQTHKIYLDNIPDYRKAEV